MGRHAMLLMARRLRRDGFDVRCFAYNTVTGSLASASLKLAVFASQVSGPVSLVGHSLGGLVCLQAAQALTPKKLEAVVLLGSPYQGSKAAELFNKATGGARSPFGRALQDWAHLPHKPTVRAPVFTLIGTRPAGLGRLVCRFDAPNDGTVGVSEASYPGAISLLRPVSHTGMLFDAQVAQQVSAWLREANGVVL
jgi:pimeloyl-ACP methyl ester carboxylesterase